MPSRGYSGVVRPVRGPSDRDLGFIECLESGEGGPQINDFRFRLLNDRWCVSQYRALTKSRQERI